MAIVHNIRNLEDLKRTIKWSIDHRNIRFQNLMQMLVTDFLNNTGLINESMDILEEELICAVCVDIPLQSLVTKCNHIFCAHCLKMCLQNDTRCPMCRTFLAISEFEALHMIDAIVFAVRAKHDSQYQSWVKQEKFDRFCLFNTNQLRCIYDEIIKCLEKVKSSNNDEKLAEEISNLSRRYLALLKELPCSDADANSFLKKKQELFVLSKHVLKPVEALGYLRMSIL